ncbi:putative cytochrome P450 313a4 [Cochliomyia hominivorax]
MDLIFYTVVSIVLLWIINLWVFKRSVILAYKIPSNKWNTFFGFGKIAGSRNVMQILKNASEKYGPNSLVWMGPIPVFVTSDPETIKTIFMSKNCINKPSLLMNGITLTVGFGLESANEPAWSRHRKVLNKTFSPNNLLSFLPIFNKEANRMIENLDKSIEKGGKEENFNLFDIFEQSSLKITTTTILNRDLDPQKTDLMKIVKYFRNTGRYVCDACLVIYYKINYVLKLSEKTKYKPAVKGIIFCRELIKESWHNLRENKSENNRNCAQINSALDYAFNGFKKELLDEEEAHGSLLHLFFGAVDTTATLLYYILTILSMYPEYQERLYEEILSVIPANSDNDDVTLEHLNKCTYLEMVVNEILRILPVVPGAVRLISNEDLKLPNGITLPRGQFVAINIFGTHRNKEVWGPEANTFNPNNFLPSNIESRHPFAFIPFTKGLRFCIGWKYALLSVKIFLIKIMKKYKFSTDFKYEDLRFENHIVLKLVEEPHLHLQRREIIS